MKKLLIIDDDYIVRLGMAESIDWKGYGIEVCGAAENGMEGLEAAKRLKPDLIICDMKMPVMNGIEFVKNIDESQDCAVIILSGFDDYEYVKESFENGVYSYLLKPIDNQKLISAALSALDKLEEKRRYNEYIEQLKKNIPELRQKFLFSIAEGSLSDISKIKSDAMLYGINISGGNVFYIRSDETTREAADILYNNVKDVFDADKLDYIIEKSSGAIIALIKNSDIPAILAVTEKIVSCYERGGRTFSCGISDGFTDAGAFVEAARQAYRNSKIKLFPIISSYAAGNENREYKPIILQAMKYMSENYAADLTVKSVADNIFVSPSHLMHIFKEELNKTFNECLTDFRILLAKRLLRENKYKVYEISETVGYTDVKYFSQVFRKKTGMTPTEYVTNTGN